MLKKTPGPIHLNFPFKEPLLPNNLQKITVPTFTFNKIKKTTTNFSIPLLNRSNQPIIIVGPMEENQQQQIIIQLAEKIKAPIFADPLSQIRYHSKNKHILSNYDLFLRFNEIEPTLIIRFGRKPTSKILNQLLDNYKTITVLIDTWEQFNDDCPQFIQSTITKYCTYQISNCNWEGNKKWLKQLLNLEKVTTNIINDHTNFFEGKISKICLEKIDNGGNFFVGNSMPIRNIDMYSLPSKQKINVYSNRGASGIDGIISSAMGMSYSSNTSSLLLIGDVSFYHDMNGLLAAEDVNNLTIIVINNNGGGIFSFLPIAQSGISNFNKYWTTNPNLKIKKIADLYNCKYYFPDNLNDLKKSIKDSFKKNGVKIIEVKININENIKSHSNLLVKLKKEFSIN